MLQPVSRQVSSEPAPRRRSLDRRIGFGLVGLDSSHAVALANLLNGAAVGASAGGSAPQAFVATAWPGEASSDFVPSHTRLARFTAAVCSMPRVRRVNSLGALAAGCDVVVVTATDVRRHARLVERLVDFGKPIFVDKLLAMTPAEAESAVDLCARAGVPIFSASPRRFSLEFISALEGDPVSAIELEGPMPGQPPISGPFWYGVHLVDMAYGALGPGCETLSVESDSSGAVIEATWRDGRTAVLRCASEWSAVTSAVLHRGVRSHHLQVRGGTSKFFAGLVEAIVDMAITQKAPIAGKEIVEIVRFLAGMDACIRAGGGVVEVSG